MSKTWSQYQKDIFAFIEKEQGNAVVVAVAGSGKSTTIVEGMNRIPAGAAAIFLAFNKSIAEELKARGVNARTFHSLTYSPVTRFKNTRTVEPNKLRMVAEAFMPGNDFRTYGTFAAKLVGLARQIGIGCLVEDTEEAWMRIVIHHDIELDDDLADIGVGIQYARSLLHESNLSPLVDFDDLLYMAVKEGLSLPKFDFVFVDEAQDTNAIQRALLRKIMKPSTRVIAVGDPSQAIYGFRGADSNSLNLIAREFSCKSLPLTVSYRCPTSVVQFAQQWVSHIEAAPNAPAGEVLTLGAEWNTSVFKPRELVVSRTTKGLIELAYKLLRARVPAYIMGREIGNGLKSLINKMKAKGIDQLEIKLGEWAEREAQKAIAKQQDDKVEAIYDKVDAVRCLIDGLPETERTIPSLLTVIDTLFNDKADAVILATIHKAKGLEADTVYWLNSSECPSKWARQDWQKQQEANLCYVAVTRAKQRLVLIEIAKEPRG
jgi:superfamily I DNA/RNA helicase